jgi:hypothetical protein
MVLEVAAEFESRGVTGHPLLWRQQRNRIAADRRQGTSGD